MMSQAGSTLAALWLPLILSLTTHGAYAARPTNSLPPVLNAEEAATLLRVDSETLELMVVAGTLSARRIRQGDGTETLRFSRAALLEWLQVPVTTESLQVDNLSASDSTASTPSSNAGSDGKNGVTLGQGSTGPTSNDVFLREQSVLSAAGDLSLDLGFFYARQESEVVIGDASPSLTTTSSRAGLIQGVLRYSFGDDTELFVRGSADRLDSRLRVSEGYLPLDGADSRTSLAVGVRHAIFEEAVGRPEVILSAEGRLRTGTSSEGLGGSASLVKNLDPVVIFGSIAYAYVNGSSFNEATLLEHRHTLRANIGYAVAMNDRFSLNFSMEAGYLSRTTFADAILLDDDYAGLQFGMTMKVSPSLYLQPNVGYSLSSSGSAYTIGLSVPLGLSSGR